MTLLYDLIRFILFKNGVSFTKADIDRLKEQSTRDDKFKGIDILITTTWPKGIEDITKTEVKYFFNEYTFFLFKNTFYIICRNISLLKRGP